MFNWALLKLEYFLILLLLKIIWMFDLLMFQIVHASNYRFHAYDLNFAVVSVAIR